MRFFLVFLFTLTSFVVRSQHHHPADSTAKRPLKLEHAEPLYIDLIRDLGAHKGEKEWNIGAGMTDNLNYDSYEFLIEYEWAPIDRLGLEVEVPFTMYTRNSKDRLPEINRPSDRVESLKLAAQYTFLVNAKLQTSMALGQITEFEFADLDRIGKDDLFSGLLFNPFLVVAKRWGGDFHTLVYTGPRMRRHFGHSGITTDYEVNTSLHYMIPGSRNFLGVELNKDFYHDQFKMVIRPQMRLVIHESLMMGIVTGIPISKTSERLSSFVRLIYEPGSRKSHHKH
ncbi:phosphoribosylformylglycinamidine synthase [Pontibacter qinzhouensis]|uniref:Phosphoribosylformylglycinamidine synthase n=1 Tax=Pontibacter qinzhouensis TaxID=2603253 RepID=A0A5C8K901_9BACT|nr:HAEPLYID family protein [Pontibacter qinzhouensis]TXK47554.1 phosphoribosylformylglycinamidine synthase [Pontibacter qinzhouensis]